MQAGSLTLFPATHALHAWRAAASVVEHVSPQPAPAAGSPEQAVEVLHTTPAPSVVMPTADATVSQNGEPPHQVPTCYAIESETRGSVQHTTHNILWMGTLLATFVCIVALGRWITAPRWPAVPRRRRRPRVHPQDAQPCAAAAVQHVTHGTAVPHGNAATAALVPAGTTDSVAVFASDLMQAVWLADAAEDASPDSGCAHTSLAKTSVPACTRQADTSAHVADKMSTT